MTTYNYIKESTGEIISTVKTHSWVLAEEYFELTFWYLPIVGYKTVQA